MLIFLAQKDDRIAQTIHLTTVLDVAHYLKKYVTVYILVSFLRGFFQLQSSHRERNCDYDVIAEEVLRSGRTKRLDRKRVPVDHDSTARKTFLY